MLTLITSIFGIVGPLVTQILANRGVIGTGTQNLINSLSNPLSNLIASLSTATTKTQDALAVLAAAQGVVNVLKASTGLPADVLTEINNIDADIQKALIAYAQAGKGFDASIYTQAAEV